MSHETLRFTKYKVTTPATWFQIKALTRLCTHTLGADTYHFGLQANAQGLTCRRKTTATNWKKQVVYDPKDCLLLHFASETSRLRHTQAAVAALSAHNKCQQATAHVGETKESYHLRHQHHQATLEALSTALRQQASALHELQDVQVLYDSLQERTTQATELHAEAVEKERSARADVVAAEARVKKVKKKTKKLKSKTKKKELRTKSKQALEIAENNAASAFQELEQYKGLLERNQTQFAAVQNDQLAAQSVVRKSTQHRHAKASDVKVAMQELAQCNKQQRAATQLYDAAKKVRDTVHRMRATVPPDPTFSNWPRNTECGVGFPSEFKNYEAWTAEDNFELEHPTDCRVDVYFHSSCGQKWTQHEQIVVCACIGTVLGWLPVGGRCCSAVLKQQDDFVVLKLAQAAAKMEEQRLVEARWKKDGLSM